ncbi:MAG: RsmB/NOP family class I SAM-dependent RNA methyltransferase [Haloferacaceae archaeon]
MDPLDRYEPLVDDPAAFREACARPLPHVVRVNTVKTTVERARRALDEEGVSYDPVGWHPGLLELPDGDPGRSWPYFHGWLHGQEEVSALPPLALDPDPGERVWAACAAPGSKATQLAALMDDAGLVVANDNNLGRLSALRHNAERLGLTAMAVTNRDARNYSLAPFGFDAFDRALVDVPCSCEGTVRKNPDVVDQWTLDHVRHLAGVQTDVLRRAVQATRPGGTVVYSTCTFAPEENEAVLDAVLDAEDCRIVPYDPPLDAAPGVVEWEGERFDGSVRNARRVYPHLNDTGGFFCAKLEVGG